MTDQSWHLIEGDSPSLTAATRDGHDTGRPTASRSCQAMALCNSGNPAAGYSQWSEGVTHKWSRLWRACGSGSASWHDRCSALTLGSRASLLG